MNNNCELLFEYLKSILYDQETKPLDIDKLEDPYKKLGKGLLFLQTAVEEMMEYSSDLSKGNLSGFCPSRDNFLCTNLKNLHANLNHLTWQAKQVASGDYSQHVSYLGEFSDAFNTMTEQLKERECQLKEEAEKYKRHAEVIDAYNDLLIDMTRRRNEWMLVIDADTKKILFCNKSPVMTISPEFCDNCPSKLPLQDQIFEWSEDTHNNIWETCTDDGRCYRITTYPIEWRGHYSYVHVISDITAEHEKNMNLASHAYHDAGTGIYNRLYFDQYIDELFEKKQKAILCYIDLDDLKIVNDNFGHLEGDAYLADFVVMIQKHIRSADVFARFGGDEFIILFPDCPKKLVEERMALALDQFIHSNIKPYPVSFSYGIVEIDPNKTLSINDIIRSADTAMYARKRKKKGRNV